ncbi:hypothetical protein Ddc_14387 [Ditylenchus destructor]|nr:hypothetical protein Ddc_14387 [Ditylenchus destructor]
MDTLSKSVARRLLVSRSGFMRMTRDKAREREMWRTTPEKQRKEKYTEWKTELDKQTNERECWEILEGDLSEKQTNEREC